MSTPPSDPLPAVYPAAGADLRELLAGRLDPARRAQLATATRLAADRGEPLALVGGPVRDLLLGRPVLDLDLVVEGEGPVFALALGERLGAAVRTHSRFGTATVGGESPSPLDVATARRERYLYPGALPEVEPASLAEDLARRDVTINAMALRLEPDGRASLLDPLAGTADLRARLLRLLHAGSLREDPTRILRLVRYAGRFSFRLEERTAGWVEAALATRVLGTVSPVRLAAEIDRILVESDPVPALGLLTRLGVDRALLGTVAGQPEDLAARWHRLEEEAAWFAKALAGAGQGTPDRGALGWLLLTEPAGPAGQAELLHRFQPGSTALQAWEGLQGRSGTVRHLLDRPNPVPDSALYQALQGLSSEALVHLLTRTSGAGAHRRVTRFVRDLLPVRPWVDGRDLTRLGVPSGPERGRILARLFHAQLDGQLADRAEALAEAARLASGKGEAG
jgi:tRNA nucleotidyltransferase (CCA-adding enzyme)